MIKNNLIKEEKGFTLVEMAIGMVIISLLVAFATVAFSGLLRRGFEKKTFADMEVIADSIAVYAQKHMRVPCPADLTQAGGEPFGTERDSGANGTDFGTCDTIDEAEGIIPFATLGLPQKMARDRFGNYITYRVSLTSAQTPAVAAAGNINNWCRTEPYWYNSTINRHVAPAKAAFCCGTWGPTGAAGIDGDIEIRGSFGLLPNLNRKTAREGGSLAEYGTVAAAAPTEAELRITPPAGGTTIPPTFPAFILVSHGQNGNGALQTGGNRETAGLNAQELENANDDVIFYTSDRIARQAPTGAGVVSLFRPDMDDIVYWQTPAQIIGRIGGMSCTRP